MDIRQLKYFEEICRYGNFSHAAKACFISSQGISMAILRLEEELGCKLFSRTNKGMVPTQQGEFLLPRAKQVLTLVDECEAYFKTAAEKEGFLTVMLSIGTIEEFAGVPIALFRKKYPNVRLDIQETYDVICDSYVENKVVELAITVGPVDEEKFDSKLLFSSRHVLIVNENHPLAKRETVSVKDLVDTPVSVLRDTTKTYQMYRDACRKAGFEPKVDIFADNILLVYYMAELNESVGISVVQLAERQARPNLRAIPFEYPVLNWNVYLIKLKGAVLSPAAKAFEQVLLDYKEKLMSSK